MTEITILKYLDVFIGFSLVMVLACTAVAAITDLVASCFYLRAQYLRRGLQDFLSEMDGKWTEQETMYIAQLLQRHPAVARPATLPGVLTAWMRNRILNLLASFTSWTSKILAQNSSRLLSKIAGRKSKQAWLPSGAPAEVIQRHEIAAILLEWAAGEGVYGRDKSLDAQREKIRTCLAELGISNPSTTLRSVRAQVQAQEYSNAEKPSHLWHTAALIDACPTDFVDRVHTGFDAMTTRTSARFALQAKLINGAVAALLVVYMPLDSLGLLRKLSTDEATRADLVKKAEETIEEYKKKNLAKGAEDDKKLARAQESVTDLRDLRPDLSEKWSTILTNSEQACDCGIVPVKFVCTWIAYLPFFFKSMPGLLLSWLLLSLGAPFWYDKLKDAMKLRTLLAAKDEKEKAERSASQAPLGQASGDSAQLKNGVVSLAALPTAGFGTRQSDSEDGEFHTAVG
jgi:hypothetical protein